MKSGFCQISQNAVLRSSKLKTFKKCSVLKIEEPHFEIFDKNLISHSKFSNFGGQCGGLRRSPKCWCWSWIYNSKQKQRALHTSERTIVPRTVIFKRRKKTRNFRATAWEDRWTAFLTSLSAHSALSRAAPSHGGDQGPKDSKAREGHQSWTNSRLGRALTPPTDEYPYDDYEGFDDDGLFKYDDDPRDD